MTNEQFLSNTEKIFYIRYNTPTYIFKYDR